MPEIDQAVAWRAVELEDVHDDLTIRRRPLHGSVADHLRAMIIRGDIAPGDKVPVQTLADALGVSMTPVREALKVLVEEQLVEWLPNRGARVLPFTAEEAIPLFEVLAGLEGLAAELAATRMTALAREELEAMHAQMRVHYEKEDKEPYFNLNSLIHAEILKAAANPILLSAHVRLQVRAARGRYVAIIDRARWDEAMCEHEVLMVALRERNAARAGEIWRKHLQHTGQAVRRAQTEAQDREAREKISK